MASESTTATPAQMVAALHDIGDYREALTNRAAGIIWILWGLVLAAVGLHSTVYFLGSPGTGWADGAAIVVFGAAGAIATNAVWRSQALRRDDEHRAWVAWLVGIGVPMALGAVVMLSNEIVTLPEGAFPLAPVLLLSATGAFTISLVQRHHVWATPGFIAAGVLMALFLAARFVPVERQPWLDTVGSAWLAMIGLLAFAAVGLVHVRRG